MVRLLFLLNKIRYEPVKVVKEDWDFLIILDACRYDVFKEVNEIPGRLEKRSSAGTHTAEWVRSNFNRNHSDIIYISATPQVSDQKLEERLGVSNPFYHLENVWDWGWDEDLGTVHPREVNKATIKLNEEYPEKRFILHYVQPHSPFIGDYKLGSGKNKKEQNFRWQDEVEKGELSTEVVRKAYEGNLKLVLTYVEDLVNQLEGKIIITSDHGESFGEFGVYAHPPAIYMKPLLEVPWLIVPKELE